MGGKVRATWHPAEQPPTTVGLATCPTCGKQRYRDRKTARRAARRTPGWGRMNAYRCGNFWHLGHLPAGVTAGKYTRDDLVPRPRQEQA